MRGRLTEALVAAVVLTLASCDAVTGGGTGTLSIHSYSEVYSGRTSELTESTNVDAILSIDPAIAGQSVFVTAGDGRLEISDVPVGEYTISPVHTAESVAKTVTVPRGVEVPVVVEIPRAGIYLYLFNHDRSDPPFGNAAVREAFSIAIDRSAIGTALASHPDLSFDSAPPMAYSFIPPTLRQDDWTVTAVDDGRPSEAESLTSSVSSFGFDLLIPQTEGATHESIAAETFPAIENLSVVSNRTQSVATVDGYLSALAAGEFELGRAGWLLDSNNLYRYFQVITNHVDEGATQYYASGYSSSELAARLADMKSALDQGDLDAYETAALAVNTLLVEDAFAVPLFYLD